MPLPQVEQQLLIPPIPASLPSQVDQTLDSCPRFRILLVGNSGVGKSSLVRHMFNVDPEKIDVADGRAGDADIEHEYESSDNPRFVLHDSKGFEAGSATNWDKVERFLRRCQAYPDLSRRVHAIWFCLLTPRQGARLLEAGDEQLLKVAIELKIPIIGILTKYDLLINQFLRKKPKVDNPEEAASKSFDSSVEKLQRVWRELSSAGSPMACVRMSISDNTDRKATREMLTILTNVTRAELRHVEGELWIPWAAAQQINARQKVELSIHEGVKKYWKDLGQSVVFKDQTVIDCLRRIHEDILTVWNFRDPHRILVSPEFFSQMIGLVAPLIDDQAKQTSSLGDKISNMKDLIELITGVGGTALALPLSAVTLGFVVLKFIYSKYQRYDWAARVLATYIVNLVLVLHEIFMNILPSDPPRSLSLSIAADALASLKSDLRTKPLGNISPTPEGITQVIKARLRFQDQ
ncbi:hypothetical protein CVT26_010898 [Gymnopilus dilepis]|uniref:G domain-containing protein n=1 Tax=Gymnopilus dilepis TaxID=231916 RepID=A0A409WSR6_9AGAR|nr:hypothetical protein CVT26_010898 [Gymnopilus dilepis]